MTHIYHLETLDFNLGTNHIHHSHLSSLQKNRIKCVDVMFCKDDRCEWWVWGNPAVETAGFKMIDVISCDS